MIKAQKAAKVFLEKGLVFPYHLPPSYNRSHPQSSYNNGRSGAGRGAKSSNKGNMGNKKKEEGSQLQDEANAVAASWSFLESVDLHLPVLLAWSLAHLTLAQVRKEKKEAFLDEKMMFIKWFDG